MTSKSSFLVSMKENNKRRLWVWIISALAYMLALPALAALTLNTISRQYQWVAENYGSTVAGQIIHEKLVNSMCGILGLNVGLAFMTAAIALVSAVQGFSYLYSRKKIDFYMGMPVKRKKRFLVIWANGILLYILPYLAGIVITMLIAAGNGAMDKTVLQSAAAALLANVLLYLGVYHMAILAVMLTGNIVVTGFAFLTFCLYEFLLRVVAEGYKEIFFKYFTYFGSDRTPKLSPFSMYYQLAETFNYLNRMDVKYLIELLVFAVVTGAVSYFCYLKRPAEAAGRAMIFEITKPFVKILLVIPAALLMGGIVSDAINFNPEESMDGIGWMIFAMTLTVIIGSALIQVIYEFDIKGCLHKKSHIVINAVCVALIFIAFRYDLFGYDGYIPNQNQIKSIAFVPDYYGEAYGGTYFDSEGGYMSSQQYAQKYMYLGNIEEICDMAEHSMEEYNKIDRYGKDASTDELGTWAYTTILYRLKNGREVNRCLWVNLDDVQTVKALDQIIGSEEFKKGFSMGASDTLSAMIGNKDGRYKVGTSYGNMIYQQKMSDAQAKEFLEIYRKDLALANFSNVRDSAPVGILNFDISEEISGSIYMGMNGSVSRATRGWNLRLYIYPFFEDSIAYLKEHGYYMDVQADLEDIAKIQVVNFNSETAQKLQEERFTTAGAAAIGEYDPATLLELGASGMNYDADIDTRVYVDYVEADQLKEIVGYIYPYDMIVDDWDRGIERDREYEVVIYFKTDSEMTKNYGTNAVYGFLEGQVPDFVKEDTVYKE